MSDDVNNHASDNSEASENKRAFARRPVALVVEYDGADDLVSDYTENLSSGGVFVNTTQVFHLGTEVNLVLSFPGLLQPIKIAGAVKWTRSGSEDTRGVGLEFKQQTPEQDERIDRILRAIHARDPQVMRRIIKVLVVEDNPHVAKLIQDGLRTSTMTSDGEEVAFNFRSADNGRDALDMLKSEFFDTVIIDVYMPILDGASVIEQVRQTEHLKKLPIIAVSAGGPSARESAMEAGADFFLDKPMKLRQVISTMQTLFRSPQ